MRLNSDDAWRKELNAKDAEISILRSALEEIKRTCCTVRLDDAELTCAALTAPYNIARKALEATQ